MVVMQVIIVLLKYCGLLVKPGDEKSWITQKSYYISKSLKILVLNFLDFNNVRWNPLEAVAAFLKGHAYIQSLEIQQLYISP